MDQYPPTEPNAQPADQPPQPPAAQPYQPPAAPPYQPPAAPPYQPTATPPYQPPAAQPPAGTGYQAPIAGAGYQAPPSQPAPQPGYGQPAPAQPYQQQGGQYYQAPPPPPDKPKKGFNWLMCCGITCGCLLVLGIIAGIGAVKMGKNFAEWVQSFDGAATAVNNTDPAQIRAEATVVDSRVLAQNPESYTDQWICVEGIIAGDVSGGTSFNMGQYGTENSTTYYLEGGVMVMDISQAPSVGYNGDRIRAYGQAAVMDLSKMPLFGKFAEKALEEAAKNDPTMKDVPTKIVMFYTRDVEKITAPEGEAEGSDVAPPWEQSKW